MIVAIDGPAGAGKSSVARRLAERLGFAFLDTGAMYRAVTLACLQNQVDIHDPAAASQLAATLEIRLLGEQVWLNQKEVTNDIRDSDVTRSIRPIADNYAIRQQMVQLQREFAQAKDVVTEGRDQGTVAFPDADCKIFLTASPAERARRRVRQLEALGAIVDFKEILHQQEIRDAEDEGRQFGGLRQASDAEVVQTDGMSEDQVLEHLICIVEAHRRR